MKATCGMLSSNILDVQLALLALIGLNIQSYTTIQTMTVNPKLLFM